MENFDARQKNEQIIARYQEEEKMMIRLFIDWCRTYEVPPMQLYTIAYPDQAENELLQALMNELDTEPAIHVSTAMLLDALQTFGNEELAFVVSELSHKL